MQRVKSDNKMVTLLNYAKSHENISQCFIKHHIRKVHDIYEVV
jgi:ubiquinone biosynthesis protein Coq4